MTSTLTWLDHDAEERDRSLRILALFRERESRDELGFGGIRDAISDRLFPGTSTIQTRLRYVLLVPWVYQEIERQRVSADRFSARAREAEIALMRPLLDAREEGVFGAQAGSDIKRLPSSVYWAALGAWGIRRFSGSQTEYSQSIDLIYANRGRSKQHQEDDTDSDPSATWHPRLPSAPADFPRALTFTLTTEEASFLRDRIVATCKDSLLAWLALHGHVDSAPEPWLHHQFGSFPLHLRRLMGQARLLTDVAEAAARTYSLCLSEVREDSDLSDIHRDALSDWRDRCDISGIKNWRLDELWSETMAFGHTITPRTKQFVEQFVERVCAKDGRIEDDSKARQLVSEREQSLKGRRSRFVNRGALSQWGGSSGVGRMAYRWPTARRFLEDLLPALGRP